MGVPTVDNYLNLYLVVSILIKKVQPAKIINSVEYTLYFKTSADIVIMDSGETVEDTISSLQDTIDDLQDQITALQTAISTMQDKLDFDTVYMKDSNGNILTDGAGNNLTAVY